jgi:signal transduction histidine kinase
MIVFPAKPRPSHSEWLYTRCMATTPRDEVGAGAEAAAAEAFDTDAKTPTFAAGTRDQLAEEARAAMSDDDVAALAHDLKNPLTIIMLEANQIEQRLGSRTTPAVMRGLERIAQNAAYIDRLVSDLLDIASADAGKLDLRLEQLDLALLLRQAVERAVPTRDRHRVRLDVRDIVFAWGDEIRIERVVANLLSNAFKYSPSDGHVVLRLDARGSHACVSVIDQGPGLPAEDARRVFERYRRATTTAQPGHGLGLYTSRKIIEAHRGRIGVVSTPGRGARFFFELPRIQSKE